MAFTGTGSGTSGDPYIATTMAHLDSIRTIEDTSGLFFELGADIDAGAETDNSGGAFWNSGAGWVPILESGGGGFEGNFDFKGYKITGLFINRDAVRQGLFGLVTGGILENFWLVNPNIDGGASGRIGALVGEINTSVTAIRKGKVEGGTVQTTGSEVGPIVGDTGGFGSGVIGENVYSDGVTVRGNDSIGGIVGFNNTDGIEWRKAWSNSDVNTNAAGTNINGIAGRFDPDARYASNFVDADVATASSDNLSSVEKTTTQMQALATYNQVATYGIGEQLTGTVDITAGSATVTGTGTLFTTELAVGNQIRVGSEVRTIDSITNDTELITTTTFSNGHTGAEIWHAESSDLWDIVTKDNHDGQEATAVWFIEDGADYPRLWFEYTAPADSTAPTVGDSGTLATANVKHNQFDVTYTEATDDTSDPTALRYYLYTSTTNNVDTVNNAETNGTLQNAGGTLDVASITASGLDNGNTYYFNVIVEDEAGNKAAYTQNSQLTNAVGGIVTLNSNPVSGVTVDIETVDNELLDNPVAVETVTTDAQGVYDLTVAYDSTKNYHVALSEYYIDQDYSGTAESATANTLTDTDQGFVADEFGDGQYVIKLTGGTGSGQLRKISSNTTDTVTVNHDWDVTPDATTTYKIGILYSAKPNFIPSLS